MDERHLKLLKQLQNGLKWRLQNDNQMKATLYVAMSNLHEVGHFAGPVSGQANDFNVLSGVHYEQIITSRFAIV